MERRFVKAANFQNTVRNNDSAIFAALVTSPGSTSLQVQTATALNQIVVDQILAFGVRAGVVVARADFSGVVRYWRADTWASRVILYVDDARLWGDAVGAQGALEGALATALVTAGLPAQESQPLATALVNALVNEGTGETAS